MEAESVPTTAALRPRKHWSEMTDVPPPEGGSAIEELRHTLAHYQPEPDEAFVVVATRNVYGDKITTGRSAHAARNGGSPMTDKPTATAAPWECGRCGEKFAAREVAQRHADQCDRPAMRVVAGITPDSARSVRRD